MPLMAPARGAKNMASRNRLIGVLVVAAALGAGALFMVPGSPFAPAASSPVLQVGAQPAADAKAGEGVAFDKARTMKRLREICAIGPRISGTPGMEKQI